MLLQRARNSVSLVQAGKGAPKLREELSRQETVKLAIQQGGSSDQAGWNRGNITSRPCNKDFVTETARFFVF
mgnify:CR=1 FL=1